MDAMKILGLLAITLFLHVTEMHPTEVSTPPIRKCGYYNKTCAIQPGGCDSVISCDQQGEARSHQCFTLWTIEPNGTTTVSLKGCFIHEGCVNQPRCIEKAYEPKNNVLFCCCDGDMCNQDYSWEPQSTESPTTPSAELVATVPADWTHLYYIIGSVLTVLCIGGAGIAYFLWFRSQKHLFNGLPTSDPHPMPPPSPQLECRPIQLLEVKAHGRFGAVWRAQFKSEEVAVKIFPVQDQQSWKTEKDIFRLPYMEHPNILEYIGAEKRGDNLSAEFWLITAYHERGSLCDYLKANTLTWQELCKIAESMGRGLTHLHESIPAKIPGEPAKPTVAHRDFKSKNVLLKTDLTACIADFGLAITFEAGKSCGDTHGQVGTRRYMAPEVLEGAINFTTDSFLRIDMYACGLVLWELVSRCKAQDGPIPEYRLPFEEEVGTHPTLEDMQEHVVQNKVRPVIQPHWRNHPGLAVLSDTMEECWDHDPEARLSASCVVERIAVQKRYQHPMINFGRIENDSLCQNGVDGLV